ncbi:unnamed protein product [Ostreobium quekettii]|uniref:Uncharacterized protein n=1 Tax=Ostreobium quekettii TaxID=121088 RepID=A0A8S1J032_9CHLO|nr:unnamed protein product [Ostreobium quekettii]
MLKGHSPASQMGRCTVARDGNVWAAACYPIASLYSFVYICSKDKAAPLLHAGNGRLVHIHEHYSVLHACISPSSLALAELSQKDHWMSAMATGLVSIIQEAL